MSAMTLGDVLLVLEDLLGAKRASLEETLAFKLYGPSLAGLLDKISGVQKSLSAKPLSEELKAADLKHDTSAKAVYYICRGLIGLSTLDGETRSMLNSVRDTFVPALAPLQKSYEDEAFAAKQREGALESMKPQLEAFPVGSTTLYGLLKDHISAGAEIEQLLSARAETTAEEEANRVKDAGILRSQAIGLLGQLRETLAHEVATNTALPRDLESVAFSYFDQLSESREGRRPKPKPEAGTVDSAE